MSAIATLNDRSAAGVSVWVDGARLRFRAVAPLSDSLLEDLRAYKSELLVLLAANGDSSVELGVSKPPEPIAELGDRVSVWRIDEADRRTRFIVAGHDHDLRRHFSHARVTPLFDQANCANVRRLSKLCGGE